MVAEQANALAVQTHPELVDSTQHFPLVMQAQVMSAEA